MNYLEQIIYLSRADFNTLINNGTLTKNNQTITYNENNLYITPENFSAADISVTSTDNNKILKIINAVATWSTLLTSDIPTLSITDKTTGTLTVDRGGTGVTSFTANSLIMSGNTTTSALTTRAITDNTSNAAITNNNTNIPTMNTLYYSLATINNTSQSHAISIYAPTSAGTANQILTSAGGTSAPTWLATANGAAYATSSNGVLTFGTLPVAQGGTGVTNINNIQAGKDGNGDTISSTYLKLTGGTLTNNLTISTSNGARTTYSDGTQNRLFIGVFGDNAIHGLYSYGYGTNASNFTSDNKYMIYRDANGQICTPTLAIEGSVSTKGAVYIRPTNDTLSQVIWGQVSDNYTFTSSSNITYTGYPGSWTEILLQPRYSQVSNGTTTWGASRIMFRQFSAPANSGTRLSNYETYVLPETTNGLSGNSTYNILTSKNTVTVGQGGTGAANAVTAMSNLGIKVSTITLSSNADIVGTGLASTRYMVIGAWTYNKNNSSVVTCIPQTLAANTWSILFYTSNSVSRVTLASGTKVNVAYIDFGANSMSV